MTQKINSLVSPIKHGQPEQVLDKLGEMLSTILDKRAEQGQLLADLWQRYLMDCNRHGVKPQRPKVAEVPDLLPFPCRLCNGLMEYEVNRYRSPLTGGFKCKECGRLVCCHCSQKKPLCQDCASPPVESPL